MTGTMDLYQIPIDGLELSVRASNALRNYRQNMSLGLLLDMVNTGEIKRIPNLGTRSIKEIEETLKHVLGNYKSQQQKQDEDMLAWCHQNLDLMRALMKGHAVILPTICSRREYTLS